MVKKFINMLHVAICGVLVFQLAGCGTILYPERKGQKDGKIDAGVAVLDGIGLLFFIIPGVIAYVVDFNNGTIYLPGGPFSSLEAGDFEEVKFDPKNSTMASVEEIIKRETGYDVSLYQNQMKIVKLKSSKDMLDHFAEALPGMQHDHIAFLNKQ